MDTSYDSIKRVLQGRGIRPSFQRIKVYEYLHKYLGHPAVEEIYSQISCELPSLSRATVYNTLDLFLSAGLIRVISIDGIEKRFDITLHDHGHIKCERCKKIFNFAVNIDEFQIDELSGFEIFEKNVYFNGICPECRN